MPNKAKEEVNMAKKKAIAKKKTKKEVGEQMVDAMMNISASLSLIQVSASPPQN